MTLELSHPRTRAAPLTDPVTWEEETVTQTTTVLATWSVERTTAETSTPAVECHRNVQSSLPNMSLLFAGTVALYQSG